VADLKRTRRTLAVVFITLGVVDVAALAMLFSPLVGSMDSRMVQLDQLRVQAVQKMRQVEPLNGLDKKIVAAGGQIDGFYKERLPGQDSVISETLGRLASASGVQLAQVKYTFAEHDQVGLRPVSIDANLQGDYLQLVRFINSLERDQVFFVVDSVDLGGEQGDTVRLHMKVRTFLKTEA